jgi:riboflavin-specific deaminase-like protein
VTESNLKQRIEDWWRARSDAFQSDDRPFTTLAYAQSWDGSLTTHSGETLSISGQESLRVTHQLRSLHDGILIGIGTLLSDDPQLTVRSWEGPNPQPIVLDSQLRTPASAKLCDHPDKSCWVLTAKTEREHFGEHAEVLSVPAAEAGGSQVCLSAAMQLLRSRGIRSLMVEGGANVITAFLQAGLVDAVVLTIAPKLIGGYKAVGDLQSAGSNRVMDIRSLNSGQAGADMIVWGDLHYNGSTACKG